MSIQQGLHELRNNIPKEVSLVAVSKTKPVSAIKEAYECGQRIFGENKIQEMTSKREQLPNDIQWHMIGHVQSNKVKYMAEYVDLIHGVDSINLLKAIDKEAAKHHRVIPCLLQAHIAVESTKFGFSLDEIKAVFDSDVLSELKHVKVVGLMGMASFTTEEKQIRTEFSSLKSLFDELKEVSNIEVLSMGMSGDYQIAIEEGSTMIRVGSKIFGTR